MTEGAKKQTIDSLGGRTTSTSNSMGSEKWVIVWGAFLYLTLMYIFFLSIVSLVVFLSYLSIVEIPPTIFRKKLIIAENFDYDKRLFLSFKK
jgi:hypothetical protein